jgi:hypothetical protein
MIEMQNLSNQNRKYEQLGGIQTSVDDFEGDNHNNEEKSETKEKEESLIGKIRRNSIMHFPIGRKHSG